eukprot:5316659-Prymnesium_polylepis.1
MPHDAPTPRTYHADARRVREVPGEGVPCRSGAARTPTKTKRRPDYENVIQKFWHEGPNRAIS